ncbi:MAG TPA: amino acid permease [Blastocatellia bacterium]|nr:amino acid permease [Blastocatellia bacterium]
MNRQVPSHSTAAGEASGLARRLGPFDATMIVMGGIIGSGIFMNPHVVAGVVHTPLLILGAWAVGGLIALAGAFIYAELAALRPQVGGQYAYIREALHPGLAFIYGWTLLLVVQSGGMAAVAVTFARYFIELSHLGVSDRALAAGALAILTVINCLGVRAGSALQSVLMVLKIAAIVALIAFGLTAETRPQPAGQSQPVILDQWSAITAFGAALVPVLFAYGGWQTASFVAGEIREPRKNLPRALIIGVIGVVVLYLSVNFVCVRVLGVNGLAATTTPASEVMRMALGERGARLIAIGIAISTLGFLSQSILTAPRVYFAMASDGLFFKRVAWLHPKTHAPVVAIVLQGALAIIVALSGKYEQILNYVVSIDSLFFGITAVCLFALRKQAARAGDGSGAARAFKVSAVVIVLFIAAEWLVAASAVYKDPLHSAIGLVILLAGIPVYFCWRWRGAQT